MPIHESSKSEGLPRKLSTYHVAMDDFPNPLIDASLEIDASFCRVAQALFTRSIYKVLVLGSSLLATQANVGSPDHARFNSGLKNTSLASYFPPTRTARWMCRGSSRALESMEKIMKEVSW